MCIWPKSKLQVLFFLHGLTINIGYILVLGAPIFLLFQVLLVPFIYLLLFAWFNRRFDVAVDLLRAVLGLLRAVVLLIAVVWLPKAVVWLLIAVVWLPKAVVWLLRAVVWLFRAVVRLLRAVNWLFGAVNWLLSAVNWLLGAVLWLLRAFTTAATKIGKLKPSPPKKLKDHVSWCLSCFQQILKFKF